MSVLPSTPFALAHRRWEIPILLGMPEPLLKCLMRLPLADAPTIEVMLEAMNELRHTTETRIEEALVHGVPVEVAYWYKIYKHQHDYLRFWLSKRPPQPQPQPSLHPRRGRPPWSGTNFLGKDDFLTMACMVIRKLDSRASRKEVASYLFPHDSLENAVDKLKRYYKNASYSWRELVALARGS